MRRQLITALAGIGLLSACSMPDSGNPTGAGGTTGAAGTAGNAGTAGTTGVAGATGVAGTTGVAGSTTGVAGTGAGGSGGLAGTGVSGGGGSAAGSAGAGAGGTIAGSGGRGGSSQGGVSGSGTGGASGGSGRGGGGGGGTTGANHWVGTWTGAPQLTETSNNPPASLTNSTLRQVVRVSLGGSQIRVRFSNEFGNGPVVINQAHVAVCRVNPMDSTIDTATDKALAFSGTAAVTIAQGQAVWSDPLDFTLAPISNLTVTVAFGNTPSNVTGHPGSRTTSYQQTASSNVTAANMASALKTDHWYILSGVDVMAPAAARGVVILGDSITDGRGSTTNGNDRWPDQLAKRLQANAATMNVAVMNQGIGGNVVTGSGLGPNAMSRYMRDVLNQSGVKYVIIFEGVNDIGAQNSSAATLTAAYDQFIAMAHARNLLIYGATITPFGENSYYSVAHEAVRQEVNAYIRTPNKFDGFIDFDAAVRNTATPPGIQDPYDMDGLHLLPAGYQKLADTVDLTFLTR